MERPRGHPSDERAGAARRRLELLGAQLAADGEGYQIDAAHEVLQTDVAREDVVASMGGWGPADSLPGARHRAPRLTSRARLSGEVHDHLPGRWQSLLGRGLTVQHVVVVVIVVAGLACLTAWWVISSRPSDVVPLSAPAPPASATPSAAASDAASDAGPSSTGSETAGSSAAGSGGTPASEVVVDVTGKVRKPGIVTLPAGSRVTDALEAAGGPKRCAKLGAVNLARVLVDGEQIVVGLPPTGAASGSSGGGTTSPGATAGPGTPVNLNTATLQQLDTLPGVGPVTANAILDWRTENGRFSSVDELLEVDGIGDATLADLRDLVTV